MRGTTPESLLRKVFPPMLATLSSSIPRPDDQWIYELKYDGFRAVSALVDGKVAMWSRNAIDLSGRFPGVHDALERIKVDEAVIDGEIAALDEKGAPRFQLLQRGSKGPTLFFAFDLIWLNGKDLRELPLENRRALLEKLLVRQKSPIVRLAEQIKLSGKLALEDAARRGYEGIIAKRKNSCYENRRSKEWLKVKAINAQELAIAGFTPSTHSDREIGSLILAVNDGGKLRYAGRVGTGFNAKQRVDLRRELAKDAVPKPMIEKTPRLKGATWIKPKYVAQVRFTEWTSDGSLRHPSFLGLRPDKTPMEAVMERPVSPTPPDAETRPSAHPDAATRGRGDAGKERAEKDGGRELKKKKRDSKVSASPRPRVSASRAGAPAASKVSASPRPRVPASGRSGGRVSASKASVAKKVPASTAGEAAVVQLSSPDRILYPKDRITKQDVADYYAAMAGAMIHALKDRPLALEHWNDGIDKPSWYQHNIGREGPSWANYIVTPTRTKDRPVRHLVVDRPEALTWLAQMSVLTLHMWSSRAQALNSPDWVVFDLDPAKGKGIEQAVDAALVLKKLLDHLRMPSYPKTSGKRGIHVFVPLVPGYTHEDAVEWATRVADGIANKVAFVTTERSIEKREGRLYFDALQNGYGKTVVAPYSLRAIDGAPVSAPLQWSEVNKKLDPLKFNLRTMPDRLAKVGDLFAPVVEGGISLPRLR